MKLVDLLEWWGGMSLIAAGVFARMAHNAKPLDDPPLAPIYPLDIYRQRRLHAPLGVKPRPRGGHCSDPLPQTGRPDGSGRTSGRPEGRPAA